jgi:hypothetical protein
MAKATPVLRSYRWPRSQHVCVKRRRKPFPLESAQPYFNAVVS